MNTTIVDIREALKEVNFQTTEELEKQKSSTIGNICGVKKLGKPLGYGRLDNGDPIYYVMDGEQFKRMKTTESIYIVLLLLSISFIIFKLIKK